MNKKDRDEKIINLYLNDNYSLNQIAKELKIAWGTVKSVLEKNDIEIVKKVNQYGEKGVNKNLFKEINDSDSAYWLGFLYADGSIRKDRNEISLELKEEDYNTIKDFHNYCDNKNNIREHIIKRNGKNYKSYCSSFSDENVKLNLIKLGCIPQKSLLLTFPSEEQVPQNFLYDFVRGYIDGDGYIQFDENKHRYRIVICGTKEFLSGMMKRCNWFEYCSITKDSNSNIYILTISNKKNVFNILTKLYENSNYHLDRKFRKYLEAKRIFGHM